MIVQDIVDMARFSEAAGTAVKDNTEAIILFMNAGLVEIYKRFPVETNEHIVTLVEGTTMYPLPADYMYYMSAYEEVDIGGEVRVSELPINDEDNTRSIFFPNYREVQIPDSENGAFVSIIYVAKPKRYTEDDLADDLELPDALIDCLLHYIGYKAHLGIRGDGNAETNAHFIRFEQSCKKARELGVSHPVDNLDNADRLGQRGFV